jgi:alpha-ketoglutarate-dependent taurine dioxygenase
MVNKIDYVWNKNDDFFKERKYEVRLSIEQIKEIYNLIEKISLKKTDSNFSSHFDCLFKSIEEQVFSGKGFTIIKGLPTYKEGYSDEVMKKFFLEFSSKIGKPLIQNRKNDLICDVKTKFLDIGVDNNSRGPVTNSYLQLHTAVGSILGLYCFKSSNTGGETLLAPAYRVHEEFKKKRPDLVEHLYKVYYGDRRGEEPVGVEPYDTSPIFSIDDGIYRCRYVAIYYQAAQEKFLNLPRLSDEQIEALELMDSITNQEDICFVTKLEPGDLVFVNNEQVLHGRKSFNGNENIDRHLFRVWLDKPNNNLFKHYFGYN